MAEADPIQQQALKDIIQTQINAGVQKKFEEMEAQSIAQKELEKSILANIMDHKPCSNPECGICSTRDTIFKKGVEAGVKAERQFPKRL